MWITPGRQALDDGEFIELQAFTVAEVDAMCARFRISGLPVVDDFGSLVGIITNRDMRFEVDQDRPVSEVMTKAPLITAQEGVSAEAALGLLRRNKVEKLPIVDGNGKLTGLITVKDFVKTEQHPLATKDSDGRLLVGAAVGIEALGNWYGGLGDTRLSLLANVVAMVVNVGLNAVLIYGLLGFPAMGWGQDHSLGLTPLGCEVVDACARLGILVDLAHINRRGFFDVVARRPGPLLVSHTGVVGVTPHWRNIDDEQVRAVADSGGVVSTPPRSTKTFVRAPSVSPPFSFRNTASKCPPAITRASSES